MRHTPQLLGPFKVGRECSRKVKCKCIMRLHLGGIEPGSACSLEARSSRFHFCIAACPSQHNDPPLLSKSFISRIALKGKLGMMLGIEGSLQVNCIKLGQLQGFDVIFYGDSITEQWRGSAVGADYPSLEETRSIFQSRFNTDYTSTVMAVAGIIQTQQLCQKTGLCLVLLRNSL